MTSQNPTQRSVASLAGIGAQSAARLQKLGIRTLQDLLFHLPVRYQDRSHIVPIAQLQNGMSALVCGKVVQTDTAKAGRSGILSRISDGSGILSLRFFHFSAQQANRLKPGVLLGCFGDVRYGYNGWEMVHPEYRIVHSAEQLTEPTLIPVYPLTEGLAQSTIRNAVKQAIACLQAEGGLRDWLPAEILDRHGFPELQQALATLHNPPADSDGVPSGPRLTALHRLAFEEFLAHHLALLQNKRLSKSWQAPVFQGHEQAVAAFVARLPFRLTEAQQRVIGEIEHNCRQTQPMLRLVQGDVGSGKTVVAAVAAQLARLSNFQVAVMAPTELLAEQHFRNFNQWFSGTDDQIVYLTGQLKGKSREKTLHAIATGTASIVIGTHALFQESVEFQMLGLVIIDEQHRFGVNQRLALREKGRNGLKPHQLVMTATPIPRTLAMLHYAGLDISVIDQLPPGRKPVLTSVLPSTRRQEVIDRITHWVAQHRQAYWVCTLIEESEILQCEAVENTAATLAESLPGIRIGLVHGRMKTADKDAAMGAFKNREFDVLVATTVIEVGVDVPNAGLMIIENPERLGLSQLHQLRGRVGRGNQESYCLLLYQAPLSAAGRERLAILKESNDGFVIAEKDLQLRGPGEVMGTRQTGQIQFKIADIQRDADLLDHIAEAARQIGRANPEAVPALIERWVGPDRHYVEI